ncbi:hypothetical protein GGR52DRAFT_214630 [Hypoxylon sp. FL1284]|nr:hypothetical protein GGR52DRAFT_214630 [Hypoxylon sp. FL1284]
MESLTPNASNEKMVTSKPKRIIRTYSKRAASAETTEPSSKKRRIDNDTSKDVSSESLRKTSTRQPSPDLPPSRGAKKGAITNYFKIIPSVSSSTPPPSEPFSEPIESTDTPPSSQPMTYQQKKRRRLTTRIAPRSASEDPNTADSTAEESEKEGSNEAGSKSSPMGPKSALSDTASDTLNQAAPTKRKRLDAGKRGRESKPAVQTTLSLSNQERGFTECKVCNMLYNPLHKQDAKYHAKRHATILKAKKLGSQNIEIPN